MNMTAIEVSGANYKRLGEFAVGFNATPDSAMTAVFAELDHLRSAQKSGASAVTSYESEATPNLAFTNVRGVRFQGGQLPYSMNYWNKIMEFVIVEAAKKGLSATEIMKISTAPTSSEKLSHNGFKYLPEARLSVQGQDSNGAWRQIRRLCQECGFAIEITFQWQDTPKASQPNQQGKLIV